MVVTTQFRKSGKYRQTGNEDGVRRTKGNSGDRVTKVSFFKGSKIPEYTNVTRTDLLGPSKETELQ